MRISYQKDYLVKHRAVYFHFVWYTWAISCGNWVVNDIQSDADRDMSGSCISVALVNTHTGFTCEY